MLLLKYTMHSLLHLHFLSKYTENISIQVVLIVMIFVVSVNVSVFISIIQCRNLNVSDLDTSRVEI